MDDVIQQKYIGKIKYNHSNIATSNNHSKSHCNQLTYTISISLSYLMKHKKKMITLTLSLTVLPSGLLCDSEHRMTCAHHTVIHGIASILGLSH